MRIKNHKFEECITPSCLILITHYIQSPKHIYPRKRLLHREKL